MTRALGRPSSYSDETAERICNSIATTTDSLADICKADGLPHWQTVYAWREKYPHFADAYARARKARLELIAEQILPLADASEGGSNNDIQSAKLRVDARKWVLSKLMPDTYGDKLDLTSKGEALAPPTHTIDARIQSIVLTAQRRALAEAADAESLEDEARGLLE